MDSLPAIPDLNTPSGSEPLDHAWASLWNDFAAARQVVLDNPLYQRSPLVTSQAHNFLFQMLSVAYQAHIQPRQQYPLVNGFLFGPHSTWGGPSPDSTFHLIFLDGKQHYRLWGKRNTARYLTISTYRGFPGDEKSDEMAFYEVTRDFKIEPDGRFEIIFSADKQPGNWIPLDPDSDNNQIQFRQIHLDWDRERPAELHIERVDVDDVRPPWEHGEQEMARRIVSAGRMIRTYANLLTTLPAHVYKQVGNRFNVFANVGGSQTKSIGAGSYVNYVVAVYELEPDEALIVETDLPEDPLYWNIQLLDVWTQNLGGTFFTQSSLNMEQVSIDADGKLRVVVALHDPGVHNWLDAFDNPFGMISFRIYEAKGPKIPVIHRVKLSELLDHLPKDTSIVNTSERRTVLQQRRHSGFRRWNV
jgi:hypothetical protein